MNAATQTVRTVKKLYAHLTGSPAKWVVLCRRCVSLRKQNGEYLSAAMFRTGDSKELMGELKLNECADCGAKAEEINR